MGRAPSRCDSATQNHNLEKSSIINENKSSPPTAAPCRPSKCAKAASRLETVCESPLTYVGSFSDHDDHHSRRALHLEPGGCCSGGREGLRECPVCCDAEKPLDAFGADGDEPNGSLDHHPQLVACSKMMDHGRKPARGKKSSSSLIGANSKLKRSPLAKKISPALLLDDSDDIKICDTCLDQILSPMSLLGQLQAPAQISATALQHNAQGERASETYLNGGNQQTLCQEDLYKCEQKLTPERSADSRRMQQQQQMHTTVDCDNQQEPRFGVTGCCFNSDGTSTCTCSDYCSNCDLSTSSTKQNTPSTIYNPSSNVLQQINMQHSLRSPSITDQAGHIEAGQRSEKQSIGREQHLAAPVPILSPLELLANPPTYVTFERSEVERTQSDLSTQQIKSRATNQVSATSDVSTLLLGQSSDGLTENYSHHIAQKEPLTGGDNGLLVGVDNLNSVRQSQTQSGDKGEENNSSSGGADNNIVPVESDRKNHMDWQDLAKRYGKMPYQHHHQGHTIWWKLRQSCLCQLLLSSLNFLFPIFTSFKNYSIPGDLMADIMSGFTVGILHIPQGMAYGLLAGVEPIYGLYVSVVPVIIMALMSRSPHLSYGTFAVISILLANCTESIKQTLRQQVAVVTAPLNGNQTTNQAFIESLSTSAAATTETTSTTQLLIKQLDRQSNGDNELGDALVLTNNHKSSDPGRQLLKNLLKQPQQQQFINSSPGDPGEGQANLWQIAMGADVTSMPDFVMPTNIEILTCICLLVGLIQLAMALMRLGVLSLMFSDQLVSSFTTASAVHVATSQLGNIFDLAMPRAPEGLFKICRVWYMFATKLLEGFNQHTALLSLVSLIFLIGVKQIIEPILKRRYKLLTCTPSELILMTALVVCSWFWNFSSNYGINIVGTVPTGLPVAKLPRLDLVPVVIQDALTVAVVSFAMNLSLAQMYAKRFRYKLNPNQELCALGSANLISSLFSCFPCGSSLSRTAVQSNLNAKSQISSLLSCAIVVSVICYFAPFFYNLPRSALSCIILVNLKGILFQVKDFYENWRLSKLDALVWLATFVFVLAFDVTYGLILGILTSLSIVFYRLLTPNYSILGQLPGTEIYVDKFAFVDCNEIDQVKIFRFNSALCYLNRYMFRSSIERLLQSTNSTRSDSFCSQQMKQHYEQGCNSRKVEYLIIDCSALSYCDYSGVSTLVEIIEELEGQDIIVYLASCPLKMIDMIEKIQKSNLLDHNVYPSITDAINQTRYLKNRTKQALNLQSIL